ncbi:hypothetical protein [Burkholderia sp. Ax-1719]|uniref:4'-phosphopantetheinyl transferase family protein n=1 Tax=Burkholderia sp. Ax-1719 TaxID=2608334 RepID=UPI0014234251|nr:hypothetical protein [Burkholderia sp. Ax-1719]NIE65696.1 hypothetical protein [Burkholderia sp. Ax-1719]
MAQSHRHSVTHTPDPSFIPWKFDDIELRPQRFPHSTELTLWRFRAEWGSAARTALPFHLSADEQNRAARSPSSAIAKRYLVSRAVLRNILSPMLDCPPEQIDLDDDVHAQPQLIAPVPHQTLHIRMAYAGIWVLLGMSGQHFGLSVALPEMRSTQGNAAPDDAGLALARAQSRQDSVLALTSSLTSSFKSSAGGFDLQRDALPHSRCEPSRANIIELPMPGQICAAVATHEPLHAINAVGWRSYEQIL